MVFPSFLSFDDLCWMVERQSLAPDSGYVLGLLKGIQERLNESRTELDRSEKAKMISHESLLGAKKVGAA